MKILNRVTSWALLFALVLGLFGGIPMLTTDASAAGSEPVTDVNGNPVVNLIGDKNVTFDKLTIPGWSVMEGVAQGDEHLYNDGGLWALKLADTSNTKAIWSISDKNKISAGTNYEISAQVYGGIGTMTVYFYDSVGTELADQAFTLATTAAANSWQKLSKTFTAPAGAATLAVKLSTTESGVDTVWFDSVILKDTALDSFKLALPNSDFNDPAWTKNGTVPPGWKCNKTASLSKTDWDNNGDPEVAIDTVKGAGAWFYSEYFPVLAGFPYTATIDIYQTVAAKGEFYIQFYDEGGAKQLKSKSVACTGEGMADGWNTLFVNEVAPTGAVCARILYIANVAGGITYLDNATVSFADKLVNTSFEYKYNQASGTPIGCYRVYTLDVIADDVAHTGTQSIYTGNSNRWESFFRVATPGDTFEASAWFKGDAECLTDEDNNFQLVLYFYDVNGTQLKTSTADMKPSADWQQIKTTCDAPLDAYYCKFLVVKTRGAGKVYIDDFSLNKMTDKQLPRNSLNNGGFETKESPSSVNSPVADWYISAVAEGSKMSTAYVGGDYGYALRFHRGASMTAWTANIPIEAGKTYSVTADVMGTGRYQLYIRYYASADAARTAWMKDSEGKDYGDYTSGNAKSQWQNISVAGSVAPAGATHARVWIVGLYDAFSPETDTYFDNIYLFQGEAKLSVPGKMETLSNPGFEEIDERTGMFVDWPPYGVTNQLRVVDAKQEPENVFEGRYSLAITVPEDLSGSHGTFSEKFPVVEGTTYNLSAYVMEDFVDKAGFQMGVKYYDKTSKLLATFITYTPAIGEWNYLDQSSSAPANSVYAQVFLVSGAGKGTCYFDKLTFDAVGNAEYAPVMFEKDDWALAYDEYPRLDFDKNGLEDIIRFTKSKSVCAYGYAGTVTLKSLLTQADIFLKESDMLITYVQNVKINYKLYPKLEDPTCRPEFEIAPEGFSVYPYMTQFGSNMVTRFQTLALAYAITGEAKYGERVKQYALDMAEWQYFVGYWQDRVHNSTDLSSQVTGYLVDCMIMAYDLCHDLFTKEELKKVEKATVELGLEPMYADCWNRMSRDRDMDHATGMILAACTFLTKDNISEYKKYLDMGMTYINWRLNYFLKSGVNEGHMYDSLAIDDIIVTLATLERVTGYKGPMDHPYMEQLQIAFTGFFEMVNGTLPAYGDTQYRSTYYPYSAAVFAERGNKLAQYYLAIGGGLSSNYDKLVFHTDVSIAELEKPDEREGNVNYMQAQGFGSLRTGWDILDSIMIIGGYDSNSSHNHLDQLSLQLAFNGTWMLSDTEYKDMSGSSLAYWQTKYTNTTIFVDGKPQVRKGLGSLEQVFNTHIYGYLMGSAPEAYGLEDKQPVLNQFDRHVIMLNHDSQPYYVVIDELDSNKERNFGWNFFTNGWDRLEIDGQHVPEDGKGTGNRLAISRFGNTLHSYFVGDPVTYKPLSYFGYGPTMVLESEKTKTHQFMNIISLQKGSGSQLSTMFEPLMTGESSTMPQNDAEGEINWSSRRTDTTKNTLLSVSIGSRLVMFRAGEVGDWCSFPFEVTKTQEYRVALEVGQTMTYSGTWDLYIDDTKITTYKPNGPMGIIDIDAGMMKLEAGEHRVKIVLASTPETPFGGTICSVGSITLDTGEGIGEGPLTILEEYNEGDLLGAMVGYGTVLKDVVLFNRGTNEIIGGGLATNGQQASVIGLNGSDIAEGYAVTKGTSLKYGDVVLMTAEGPVSIAMDYTMAKFPVKNEDTEEPVAVHEDFDIENPVYYVSAKADKATVTSVNVGIHAPYTVYIDGKVVESTHSGEMLTFTVPAGESQITILGTHQCVFDQHATNILNIKEWAGCGHNNVYYVSCICGKNGTETFNDGDVKGHTLKKIAAVEATETTDGNIAHYKCTKCGKLFADAQGAKELIAAEVRIPNTAEQAQKQQIILIACIVGGVLIVGGGAAALIIILKKKKTA